MSKPLADAIVKVADAALQTALRGPEPVRAVVVLKAPELPPSEVEPQATPQAIRAALITEQQTRLGAAFAETIGQFQELGLVVHGGGVTRAVVLEGLPDRVSQALELPGIRQAMLDRPIELTPPPSVAKKATARKTTTVKPVAKSASGSPRTTGTTPSPKAKRPAPKRK